MPTIDPFPDPKDPWFNPDKLGGLKWLKIKISFENLGKAWRWLMKRLFVIVLGIVLFASVSFAQAPIFKPAEKPTLKADIQQPALAAIGVGLPINLNGDTLYIVKAGTFAGGIGLDLASYKGIVSLRMETAQGGEGNPFVGGGLFVDVAKTLSLIPGVSWNTQGVLFRPAIGVVPGYSFTTNKFDWAITLSILSATF